MAAIDEILSDLSDEFARLDEIFDSLTAAQWTSESGAPGWSVLEVVTHLALTEEGVSRTLMEPSTEWSVAEQGIDAAVARAVENVVPEPAGIFERWRAAYRASLTGLAAADPNQTYRWAAAPLRPRTLATTRLAEHWAHGLDVTEPLGIAYPDHDRLRHIAWLGHATLPYALELHGLAPCPIRAELVAPSGARHAFGPVDATNAVAGSMGEFCRIGARRLDSSESSLRCDGPRAAEVLSVLRNYAG